MDNRNVKTFDENNIDRDGKVICGFSDNGNDYALFYINKNPEKDNLFVTKVVNNLDGTANMVSIENPDEKANVNALVKGLIMYSINNENDVLSGNKVVIDGREIQINNVLFNKEQRIVIPKSYVTSADRKAVKVAFDFFKLNEEVKKDDSVFENNDNTIFESVLPSLNNEETKVDEFTTNSNAGEVKAEEKLPDNVMPVEPTVLPTSEPVIEEPKFDETVANLIAKDNVQEIQKQESSTPTPVTPVVPLEETKEVVPEVKEEVTPILPVETPVLHVKEEPKPIFPVEENAVKNDNPDQSKMNIVMGPVDEKKVEEVKTEPVPVTPVSVIPTVSPVTESTTSEPKLFFDGSKETNLNMALGEASTDKVVSGEVSDVQSLREFGTSDKALENSVSTEPVVSEEVNAKKLTRSKGFANNKFFTVVAIILFIAACVFLGYEAFQYFTMTK